MSNDIKIVKGKTFLDVIRWESAPVIYKASNAEMDSIFINGAAYYPPVT